MKISVERSDLLRSMSRAQAIVERRTTIPILSNVLIEAREDRLTLRATDLDIELLDSIKALVEKREPSQLVRIPSMRSLENFQMVREF